MATGNPAGPGLAGATVMILIDSNIIIYAASGKYPSLVDWLLEQEAVVSAVTMVEVLGYHQLRPAEKIHLENLLSQMHVLYPVRETFHEAILLRQQRSLSLGDALIAATALRETLPLATHNLRDFSWITGLSLIDPLPGKGGEER